ncbi:MAG: cobalamin B12-binding domain-containing protein [Pseudomonadota bacterium]
MGNAASLPSDLRSLIEARVVPQLLLSHLDDTDGETRLARLQADRRIGDGRPVAKPRSVPADTIAKVSELLIAHDIPALRVVIEAERRFGATDETLMLEFLPMVARDLGQRWLEDRCTFSDVTVGLGALQVALRDLTLGKPPARRARTTGRRIRLLSMLPEQHTFGSLIAAEFFRFEGWDVRVGQPETLEELLSDVEAHWYDVIGFSISVDRHVAALEKTIRRLRRAASNPDIKFIAGGPLVDAGMSDTLLSSGIDAVAQHAGEAVDVANTVLLEGGVAVHQ